MSYLHGKFVWFEHLSGDVDGARRFYEGLLGWQVQTVPIGDGAYRMIQNAGQAIGGYDAAPAGAPACWRSYVSVADVDAAYPKALATGAEGLMPPANVGPMGRAATIADPGGATVSLWKSAEGDAADTPETPDGGWIWNELWTRDDQAALAFYEGLVGYTHSSMDMGPQGTYYILNAGDKGRAGLMQSSPDQGPPMWLPYVRVADCDAATAKAQALGARMIAVPPTDIPNIGRFSVVLDPQGAAFALMAPSRTG